MTEFEPIDWEARLRAAVEETLRKRAQRRAERLEFQTRRAYGLQQRHAAKLQRIEGGMTNRDQCRYLTRHGNQCTGEPVDATTEAEALLCRRHLGYLLELLKASGFTITAPGEEPRHVCPRCQREVCGCPSLEQVPYMRGDKEYIQ